MMRVNVTVKVNLYHTGWS